MDSTLPDAFDSPQVGSQLDHGNDDSAAELENGTNNILAKAPFVKVDGMCCCSFEPGKLKTPRVLHHGHC